MAWPARSAPAPWAKNVSSPRIFSITCRKRWRSVRRFCTASDAETVELGRRLARELPPRGLVLLIGNLGAGKTTLAKGIVEGLGAAHPDEVSSPTFTLIHEYGGGRVYHVDLYRLDDQRAVESLGLEELFER